MKNWFYILLISTGFHLGNTNTYGQELLTYTFEEVEQLQKKEPRPVIVFIHTDWCSYCLGMKKKTFRNEKVNKILNSSFYFVPLNAEYIQPIVYGNQTYVYKATGTHTGIHQLAETLGTIDSSVSYPTVVVLSADNTIQSQHASYMSSQKMIDLLSFYQ